MRIKINGKSCPIGFVSVAVPRRMPDKMNKNLFFEFSPFKNCNSANEIKKKKRVSANTRQLNEIDVLDSADNRAAIIATALLFKKKIESLYINITEIDESRI